MSAALLSLGERAAQGLGRGELSQVYIEGETGTVFLVSADNEAVLVAVAAQGAKVGMMMYEVRRAAAAVAEALRADDMVTAPDPVLHAVPLQQPMPMPEPVLQAVPEPALPSYAPVSDTQWTSSYAPTGSILPGENPSWS